MLCQTNQKAPSKNVFRTPALTRMGRGAAAQVFAGGLKPVVLSCRFVVRTSDSSHPHRRFGPCAHATGVPGGQ